MSALSLRDIEDTLRHADAQTRHKTLRAVADLFLSAAPSLDEPRVEVFDTVFASLVDERVRSELPRLSQRIAPVANAPPKLVKRLAHDDDISVAGPMLIHSPRLSTDDLCEIARTKGNAHMLAMSIRRDLAEPVTDILVHDGDQAVARSVAGNRSARLSPKGIDSLIERGQRDQLIGAALFLTRDSTGVAEHGAFAGHGTCRRERQGDRRRHAARVIASRQQRPP